MISKKFLIFLYFFIFINNSFAIELNRTQTNIEDYNNLIKLEKFNEIPEAHSVPNVDTLFAIGVNTIEQQDSIDSYFGYDFFTNRNNIEIWDNLPPTDSYELGPGDEIIINIWGDTQVNHSHIIDRQGKIFLDKIGMVTLSGQTLRNAEEILINRFSNIYSTLIGDNPSSSLDISLGGLKSLNITVLGQVNQPGLHKIHPFSTLTTCLFQIGGVDKIGTLRNIEIFRKNKLYKTFDFYDFISGKDIAQDTQLKDGDVVSISPRVSTVKIQGSINRPGFYEMLPEEKVNHLIEFAGGLSSNASQKIVVDRALIKDEIRYLDSSNWDSLHVKNGDVISVFENPSLVRSVAIYGQVKLPGEYPFSEKMTTLDLLKIAGGINDPTYSESMYLNKIQIVRRSFSEEYPNIILVDIEKALNGDSKYDIQLKNLDVIIVNKNPNYEPPQRIDIMGEVNIPGVYTIQKNGETLDDILSRAGGFTSKAYEDGIQMYRDTNKVVLQSYDIVVMDGDSLHVPKHPGVVYVNGEVYNPGLIQFNKNKNLSDYIESAGGYNIFADNGRVVVFYANGDVKIKKWYYTPKIKEGSTIIVYQKQVEEPFSWTEFAKSLSSIVASLATIFVLTK